MHKEAYSLLISLTDELKLLGLWQKRTPNYCDLASTAPFCCDTLAFEQWLQFIFIERIALMIKNNEALPAKISLTPMAETAFAHLGDKSVKLNKIISDIDTLFQEQLS